MSSKATGKQRARSQRIWESVAIFITSDQTVSATVTLPSEKKKGKDHTMLNNKFQVKAITLKGRQ